MAAVAAALVAFLLQHWYIVETLVQTTDRLQVPAEREREREKMRDREL